MPLVARLAGLSMIALVACGGAVETSSDRTVQSGNPSGGSDPNASSADSRPPSSTPPSPSSVPTPEPPLPAPSKIADPSTSGDTPFHLVVSNRSGVTIGTEVILDATTVVTGGFAPTSKYVFDFNLGQGTHTIAVKTAQSQRSNPAEKTAVFELEGTRWGTIDLSTVRCDPCSPTIIGWELRDTAP